MAMISDALAIYNLGSAFQDEGKLDEAVTCYRRALELKPDFVEAQNDLGTACLAQGKLDEAVASFVTALELEPAYVEAHCNLGSAFQAQGKFDPAVNCFRRALELSSNYAVAHYNLGTVLQAQAKLNEAIASYRRALELRPDYVDALSNLGSAFQTQGKLDEAVESYRRALELKPYLPGPHYNLGLLRLLQGDFESGLPEYEWRWKTNQFSERAFSQRILDGNPLEERTILLHAEQGLGDTLQFVRYTALVKQQNAAATVFVECPRPLEKLLTTCPGIDRLVAAGSELPPFDLHSPLLSLPGILKTTVNTIPANVPYLFADPALVGHWRERLNKISGLRVGINWQGSRSGLGDFLKRDMPLDCFAELAQIPGVRLVSLQKGAGRKEVPNAGIEVFDPGEDVDTVNGAFIDTAAIMMNLDLVITSDTSIPHLAGALGVPVWLALPFVPDWRWLLDRTDSPWYPTMRLFRQKSLGDWPGVFDEILTGLRQLLNCR